MNKLTQLIFTVACPALFMSNAVLAETTPTQITTSTVATSVASKNQETGLLKMYQALNLTDVQKEQIKAIEAKSKSALGDKQSDIAQLYKQHKATTDAMTVLIQASTFDDIAVRKLAQETAQRMIDRQVDFAKIQHDIYQLLTTEQKGMLNMQRMEREKTMEQHLKEMSSK